MPIRYVVKHLLLPPGLFLLLLVLGLWLMSSRPRIAVALFVLAVGGFWLMSLPVMVQWSARLMERSPVLATSEWSTLAARADAIVVLGSGRQRQDPAWRSDQPTTLGLERLRYAARLAKASGLPVLTSGGLHYGAPPSEAQIMSDSLRDDFGVTVRWKEEQSRTTWENAQMTAGVLVPQGIRRVVVVTQAWHMPRSVWSFQQAGFEVVPAPVGFLAVDSALPMGGWMPEALAFWQNGLLLNEAAGQVAYRFIYR